MKRVLFVVPVFFLAALATVVAFRKRGPTTVDANRAGLRSVPEVFRDKKTTRRPATRVRKVVYRQPVRSAKPKSYLTAKERGRALHAGSVRRIVSLAVTAALKGNEATRASLMVTLGKNTGVARHEVQRRLSVSSSEDEINALQGILGELP